MNQPHDISEQRYEPAFYESVAAIMKLRQKYIEQRAIFVPGTQMIPILIGLGAKWEDFDALKSSSDHLGQDPTLPCRKITHGRYCIDSETRSIKRLAQQAFNLTLTEGYKRYDSGIPRNFDEINEDLQFNTVLQTLMLFKFLVYHRSPLTPRENLDYFDVNWVCQIFNVRIFTEKTMQGEPALEGVHQDGSDHSMTVYLNSTNITSNSAVTFMHDKTEVTGVPNDKTKPSLVKGQIQHKEFMDTLVFADNDLKHSLTPVYQVDRSKQASRDMLIFFTRRPRTVGHATEDLDSFNPHKKFWMQTPLWVP